jgi:thiol-disulfide isomerase/thioredoxin
MTFLGINRVSEQVRKRIWPVALMAVVVFTAAVFCAGCKEQPAEQPRHNSQQPTQSEPVSQGTNQAIKDKSAITNTDPAVGSKLSLNDVINYRRSWNPILMSWYGKMAPDFTVTDITGKQHKLSDYRDKNVMIILWATWCGPCIMEMPHLIELRKTTGEDKLAMLAISYITTMPPNTTEMVKKMVEQRNLNYTVISVDESEMSAPYNQIRGIPSGFFIDPEGKIKLVTEGMISFGEIKAILEAEPL